jgi:3-isopropylmalate/(R)-2-methylmalate dehydratase small subunit
MENAKGKVWKFGDNINTDEIIPARYLNTSDAKELAKHCMEDADADFPEKHNDGDLIVGGINFGSGSSREHAPICIKEAGISAVIADSFARIFFRNCINIGLPIIELKDISKKIDEGDEVEVDFDNGVVKNLTKNEEYKTKPFPPFMQDIINAGGLMNQIKK